MSQYNLVISLPNSEIVVGFDNPNSPKLELTMYSNDLFQGYSNPRSYTKGEDRILEIRQHVKKNCFKLDSVVINVSSIDLMHIEVMNETHTIQTM